MAPHLWVSKPTPTLRGEKTCCARSATSCSCWMKPKPTGCTTCTRRLSPAISRLLHGELVMITLSSADAVENRETAGQHVEQILAIGGGLPVFAHRNVGHVLP